jgi:HSP20 family protein
MQREMNDVFSRFFGEEEQTGTQWAPLSMGYSPQIESRVEDEKLYVRADLPGIDPKDVEVMVEGNQLTLRGERKAAHEGKEGNYFHREVRYGSFARSFTIPEGVNAEEVQATYRNGVLELCVPLPASVLPKKVSIAIEGQTNGQKQIGRAS